MRPLNAAFTGSDVEQVIGLLPVLESMNPEMPAWTGSDDEARALAAYVVDAMKQPTKKEAR
jgi:mono/diheme cytochrome c family protein